MPPRSSSAPALTFSPTDFHLFAGLPVPDPITFVLDPKWLGRPNLYPRQATLLKVIFLRVDLLTEYDLGVIEEWEVSFRESGENGITPGIISRMHQLRREGYLWFREVLLVLGRRAGKGYVSALAMAYVLWNYLALGDPQGHFGVDRDKQLACFIYAGKKEQARENLWKDLVNVIQGGECFTSYISRPLGETLSVFAPHDFVRMRSLQSRGIISERDMATFVIQPKEATLMSGRGPTSFMQGYDEMAHQVASGANRSAEEVYGAATPALDQFKKWAFIIEPSSPWQMIGQFFTNYGNCMLEDEDGNPVYPNMFFLQLCSWEMYYDWMIAPEIDLFPVEFEGDLGEYAEEEHPRLPALKGAIQEYDEGMQKLEQANPETFAVERRCLDPNTRVLTTDLIWKPIGQVVVGDELIGIDENGPGGKVQRKLRGAQVLAKWRSVDVARRLHFDDGTSVTCSPNHRWFGTTNGRGSARWVEARFLREGSSIRRITDTWEPDESRAAGYLAGIYDGEGSLVHRYEVSDTRTTGSEYCINFSQNRGTALDTTLRYLKELGFEPRHAYNAGRPCQLYKITGVDECLRFLGQVRPYRLLEKCRYMWENHAPRGTDRKFKTITRIDELPEQELIDIETSTGTFLAEGLVSHNSHWQATVDAYLNPDMVDAMFGPWNGEVLQMKTEGLLSIFYKGHADPSLANANFAVAIAHPEKDDNGIIHCVFDYIHHWRPSDFDNNIIDYPLIDDYLWRIIKGFKPDEFTFDQWNSANSIARLNNLVRTAKFPKRVTVYEKTATHAHNWERAENFKIGLNQGWMHAPEYEQAKLELKFLRVKNGNKVEKQDAGPVQTKDVADCMMECAWTILGEQVHSWTHGALSNLGLRAHVQGGFDPHQRETAQDDPILQQLSGQRGRSQQAGWRGGARNPSRNIYANRNRR